MSFFKLQIYIYIFHLSDGSFLLTLYKLMQSLFLEFYFYTESDKRQISNRQTNKHTKVLDTTNE